MNSHAAITPPSRPIGLDDLNSADDLGADHLNDMDNVVDGGLNDSDLGTPRPDGLDDGLGTDNATGSNATL